MEVPALQTTISTSGFQSTLTNSPSGGVKALDELLDLPHLDVLLCRILTHFGRLERYDTEEKEGAESAGRRGGKTRAEGTRAVDVGLKPLTSAKV